MDPFRIPFQHPKREKNRYRSLTWEYSRSQVSEYYITHGGSLGKQPVTSPINLIMCVLNPPTYKTKKLKKTKYAFYQINNFKL